MSFLPTVEKNDESFHHSASWDAPDILCFFPLGVIYWPEGRVDRTSFEVKHLAWMRRYVASNHSNKKTKCFIKSSLSLYCAPIE